MEKSQSYLRNYFHKNGRAFGSMGYFILLMLVFLIGAPEAWLRPNLHQSVFVMMPTLIFLVIPLVFLVASGEIDLSFASTYAVAAYIFALLVKAGIDPALAILACFKWSNYWCNCRCTNCLRPTIIFSSFIRCVISIERYNFSCY